MGYAVCIGVLRLCLKFSVLLVNSVVVFFL